METTQTQSNEHDQNGGENQEEDGLQKKKSNELEFEHKYFQEEKLHRIKTVKMKNQHFKIEEFREVFERVKQRQKLISNRIQRFKYDLETSLSDAQITTETMIDKFLSTFSTTNGRKRTFLDIDGRIDFGDIEKDFGPIEDQFQVTRSDVDCLMTLSNLKEQAITRHDNIGGEGDRGGGVRFRIPKFLHKLYTMVEKEEINDLISWKLPYRDRFIIWDINKFAAHVLPIYFKHTNFSSFNSQLNIYCFKKMSREKHEYANQWFQGGRRDLLANITRRSKSLPLLMFTISCSSSEFELFTNQLKTIQQDQDNKIMWLMNYEEQVKSSVREFKETIKNMVNLVDKMIEKNTKKLENFKKSKLDIEGHEKEQASQVIEPGDNKLALRENNFKTLLGIQEFLMGDTLYELE